LDEVCASSSIPSRAQTCRFAHTQAAAYSLETKRNENVLLNWDILKAGEGEGRRKQQNRKIGRKLNLLRESFSRKNHQEQISL